MDRMDGKAKHICYVNVAMLSVRIILLAELRCLPSEGRKTCLQVAFLIGLPVKSAFALLLVRVTEPICA